MEPFSFSKVLKNSTIHVLICLIGIWGIIIGFFGWLFNFSFLFLEGDTLATIGGVILLIGIGILIKSN